MFSPSLARILIFVVTLAGSGPMIASSGTLPTIGELLKRHNIHLTRSALVGALKNSDPEVRYLAAEKLAEDKATETIPAITEALLSEDAPWTRMNIAFALAEMGDATGFSALEDDCRNFDMDAGVRTQSAQYMLTLNREGADCLDALLDVLQTASDGYRAQAASLLPQFHNLSAENSERVFLGLVDALHSSDAAVRMAAGRALADVGDGRAIAELQKAVTSELERAIRFQIEQDLRILQGKVRR